VATIGVFCGKASPDLCFRGNICIATLYLREDSRLRDMRPYVRGGISGLEDRTVTFTETRDVVTTATGTIVTQTFTKVRTETVVVATTVKQNVVVTTTVYVPVPGGASTALSGVAIARPFDAFIFIRGER
jgi:tagatose-1,6-bisphosphate aldolase non-catalytic subunit AgaZ/GatZ